jgi:hypothetical protein
MKASSAVVWALPEDETKSKSTGGAFVGGVERIYLD